MPDEIKDENKEELTSSRREAIAKGMEDVDKETNKENEDATGTNKETKKEKESSKSKSSKDDDLSKNEDEDGEDEKQETEKAIQLYKALNDPESGTKILRILAQEAGLLDSSSKKEQKVIEKSIKEVLKESLGSEYQFLSDRIGDALEKILPDLATKGSREVKERLDAREKADLSKEIDSALSETFGQFDSVPKSVEKRFNELIDEMPPVPGKTVPKVYFNRLIKIAAEEVGITLNSKNKDSNKNPLSQAMKDRISRNKNDASSRLASKGSEAEVEGTSNSVSTPPKSRREAIERAVKEADSLLK